MESCVIKLEGKKLLGNRGVDGMVILNWILKKQDLRMWKGFVCPKAVSIAGLL